MVGCGGQAALWQGDCATTESDLLGGTEVPAGESGSSGRAYASMWGGVFAGGVGSLLGVGLVGCGPWNVPLNHFKGGTIGIVLRARVAVGAVMQDAPTNASPAARE